MANGEAKLFDPLKLKYPAASQNGSPFVRLPAELKLIILRKLLVTSKPVGKPQTYKPDYRLPRRWMKQGKRMRKKKRVRGYQLHPQILATCQQLFNEGRHLLYTENTLVLNAYLWPYYSRPMLLKYEANSTNIELTSTMNKPFTELLDQFVHISVVFVTNFAYAQPEELGRAMHLLAPRIRHKHVHFAIDVAYHYSPTCFALRQNLATLQHLRCASFKLDVRGNPDKEISTELIPRIEKSVTSNTDVKDLLNAHRILEAQRLVLNVPLGGIDMGGEQFTIADMAYCFNTKLFARIEDATRERIVLLGRDVCDTQQLKEYARDVHAVIEQQEFFDKLA